MSTDRMKAILETYGADPARWPEDSRKHLDLAGAGAGLSEVLLAEQRLDRELQSLGSVAVPAGLAVRVLADFERTVGRPRRRSGSWAARAREVIWPGASWWKPAAAFSLSLLFGIWAGSVLPDSFGPRDGDQVALLDPPAPDLDAPDR